MPVPLTNWAGNVTFGAHRVHHPSTVAELCGLVAGNDRIRAIGTAHSFSRIADGSGDLVSVAGLPPTMDIDQAAATVTVAAGVRYGELATYLHSAGYALPNLASLPHISIAGACATGTHGSGERNGNLATAVSALTMVTADGELRTIGRHADGDLFCGAVVGLGALGIVTSLTLDIVESFDIRQYVYEDLPRERLDAHLAEILARAYSVSLFTDWAGTGINQVWLKCRVGEPDAWVPPPSWLGAMLADGPRNPVPGMPTVNCTEQLGSPGAWHTRLPHFRLEYTPSNGEELQSEYLVPRRAAAEALTAIYGIRDRVSPVLQICEIRTIAADDLWLSPSYRRDSVGIHFTWIKDVERVTGVLAVIEEVLAPFEARPHWGKLFTTGPDAVRRLYPRWPDFVELRRAHDPAGKFTNEFLDRYFPAQ